MEARDQTRPPLPRRFKPVVINGTCPPFEFTATPEGPIGDDPPTTLAEFLRWAKRRDPERYREVLRMYPVNTHIGRDEARHEVLTDFQEPVYADGETPKGPVASINRRVYRDWTVTAWEQGD